MPDGRASLRRRPAADAAVAALLALLCALFFWQVLTPDAADRRWFAAGDFTDQFYAFRAYLARELWAGRLPLWNPYALGGSPFLADIQSAVYYPLGLLTVLLAGKGGLPLVAVELEVIVHYFLASLFLYLLVRDLTRSRLAGLVSAIAYAFGSYLTSYPKLQMAILEGQTWVPLALLAVHRGEIIDELAEFHAAVRVGRHQRKLVGRLARPLHCADALVVHSPTLFPLVVSRCSGGIPAAECVLCHELNEFHE